jgi:peptidoglycan/LPS O-acetylase OafA/YrhL
MSVKTKAYFPYFDYLRLTLACIVMLSHAEVFSWQPAGKLAVEVFFALSGWLIGNILTKASKSELPQFYFNRAVRIWIPYYIALLILLGFSVIFDPINSKWFEFVVYKITQVYNIFGSSQLATNREDMPLNGIGNHFWSVNAEEQFYLVAPLLLVLLSSIGRKISVWILVFIIVWAVGVYPSISLGVLAAVINKYFFGFYRVKSVRAGMVIFFTLASLGLSQAEHYQSNEFRIFAPIFSICIVLLLAIEGKKTSFGEFVGGISYPLYLNHWIGLVFVNKLYFYLQTPEHQTKVILGAFLNIVFASCLYWFVERKVLQIRLKLFTNKRGVILTTVAYGMVALGVTVGLSI